MHSMYNGLPEVAIKVATLFWEKDWTECRLARRFKLTPAQCREYAYEVRLRRETWARLDKAMQTIVKVGPRHRARVRSRAKIVAAA